jgi:hypothetical protein
VGVYRREARREARRRWCRRSGVEARLVRGIWPGEDYFGPAAGVGPFTGAAGSGMARGGAVPLSPDQPGDIQPAVEIGEAMGRPAVSPRETSPRREYWKNRATAVNEHVELP